MRVFVSSEAIFRTLSEDTNTTSNESETADGSSTDVSTNNTSSSIDVLAMR